MWYPLLTPLQSRRSWPGSAALFCPRRSPALCASGGAGERWEKGVAPSAIALPEGASRPQGGAPVNTSTPKILAQSSAQHDKLAGTRWRGVPLLRLGYLGERSLVGMSKGSRVPVPWSPFVLVNRPGLELGWRWWRGPRPSATTGLGLFVARFGSWWAVSGERSSAYGLLTPKARAQKNTEWPNINPQLG
jgi:hypothetical protein